jgi:thiol-disulfide isomerase/thioredoxin
MALGLPSGTLRSKSFPIALAGHRAPRRVAAQRARLGLLLAAAVAFAPIAMPGMASGAEPTVAAVLAPKPIQRDVPYQSVDGDAATKCTVEKASVKGWVGWQLRDADGLLLRRFVDTSGDGKVDMWSYFRNGLEVYREIDRNGNKNPDEFRWLGTAGSRIGMDDDEDGKIDRWQRISAEEIASEAVAAIATKDASRFDRLLLTDDELESLGLTEAVRDEAATQLKRARDDFAKLIESAPLEKSQRMSLFAGGLPGVVTLSDEVSPKEVLVYENAVAMVDGEKPIQIQLGTLVQSNEQWRLLSLPQVVADGATLGQLGFFFERPVSIEPTQPTASGPSDELQQIVQQLESIESKLAGATEAEKNQLYGDRDRLHRQLIAKSASREDRSMWVRQRAESLSMAVTADKYESGLDELAKLRDELDGDGEKLLAAFVAYQHLVTSNSIREQAATSEKEIVRIQQQLFESLESFVKKYPDAIESAQAMNRLALIAEFESDEKTALGWYKTVADTAAFKDSDAQRIARGAVKRLSMANQPMSLEGKTLDGKSFDFQKFAAGKVVIIHYWADWCTNCTQDIVKLRELQSKYAKKLSIVGISVDAEQSEAVQFVKATKMNWPQLWAPGGLDGSPLANNLGVQTLPMMLLIDSKGRVYRHDLQASELEAELAKVVGGK